MAIDGEEISSSFRDPSGFVFTRSGRIMRAIAEGYKKDFDLLVDSGLYEELVSKGLLVKHREKMESLPRGIYKIIKPDQIPFISYPYEWCFSQRKDAALLTLKIARIALKHGMVLKDASAYNIQFNGSSAVFIDTLSFEKYKEGQPWVAYRQFCQHFLAPLALAVYCDERLLRMMRIFTDGIPLDFASNLLPLRARMNPSLYVHIFLHAAAQKKYADRTQATGASAKFSLKMFEGMIQNLESIVSTLRLPATKTEWGDYYNNTNYRQSARKKKENIVERMIKEVGPKTVWDLGANDGTYSRLASRLGIETIAFDIDPVAVDKGYIETKGTDEKILFLIQDLTNPSPSRGWAEEERTSLSSRGPADLLLALALIHHLTISNNIPFHKIAEYFSKLGKYLIIEFVPKNDSKVQKLLATREDIFLSYNEEDFARSFEKYFKILEKEKVAGSKRIIYLMRSKSYKK